MDAFTMLQNLFERDFDVRLDADGRLLVAPGNRLTDRDREAIRANLPTLKRLVSCDYTHHPEGWNQDADMPERAFLVRNGRLIDSCLFHTTTGARDFIHRVTHAEPLTLAFHAACAFEDANGNDRERPSQTESQNPITPHRKTAS